MKPRPPLPAGKGFEAPPAGGGLPPSSSGTQAARGFTSLPAGVFRFSGKSKLDHDWDVDDTGKATFICPEGFFAVVSALVWCWLVPLPNYRTRITLSLNGQRVDRLGEIWKGFAPDEGVTLAGAGSLAMTIRMKAGDVLEASFLRSGKQAFAAQCSMTENYTRRGVGWDSGFRGLGADFSALLYPAQGRTLETLEVFDVDAPTAPAEPWPACGVFRRSDLGPEPRPEEVQSIPLSVDAYGRLYLAPTPAHREAVIVHDMIAPWNLRGALGGDYFNTNLRQRGLLIYLRRSGANADIDVQIRDDSFTDLPEIGEGLGFQNHLGAGGLILKTYNTGDPYGGLVDGQFSALWIGPDAVDVGFVKGVKLPLEAVGNVWLTNGASFQLEIVIRALLS